MCATLRETNGEGRDALLFVGRGREREKKKDIFDVQWRTSVNTVWSLFFSRLSR